MARLPLQTLHAFRAVAHAGSLRRAADELHLTPSALSQQIRLLEEQVGFALFDRPGRRIVPNAAGQALLRGVDAAIERLDDALAAAAALAAGRAQRIRLTLLPSFAQRWLLPRMGRWRERHPDIALEVHTSQAVVDLAGEGIHAALRQGAGHWRGLVAERVAHSALVAVGTPEAARRLRGRGIAAVADEPLLGNAELWERWFALGGVQAAVQPVASFNDAGLMLQAAEQGLGVALAREVLAADALREGRLVRLASLALPDEAAYAYWFVHAPELAGWAPLEALRAWLHEEMAASLAALRELPPG